MKKIATLSILFILVVGGVVFFVLSNFGKSTGKVVFSKSTKPGLNTMKVTGPNGWKCITFEKTKVSADAKELTLSGKGISELPLFGGLEVSANYYPSDGTIEAIPLDKEFLVYKSNDNLECYVLITKDADKYNLLK